MAARIVGARTENYPALRLIGKQCDCEIHDFVGDWDKWFDNGWFERFEKLGAAPENGGMVLGVTDNNGGYWIGLLFPPDTSVPDGFAHADVPAVKCCFHLCFSHSWIGQWPGSADRRPR